MSNPIKKKMEISHFLEDEQNFPTLLAMVKGTRVFFFFFFGQFCALNLLRFS
jgi:hypothetical protein